MPDPKYLKTYLTQVIARVDCASPVTAASAPLPGDLAAQALKRFPIAEPRKGLARELQISDTGVSTKESEITEWRYHGKEREKTLTIAPAAVFVEYSRYSTFDALKTDFLSVVRLFLSSFPEARASRLGLRYINNISLDNGNPLDWAPYLSPSLLCILRIPPDQSLITRAFHNLELGLPGFSLRFQYGIHNPDYPAHIRRRTFVLDFDAYYQGLIEPTEIANLLESFHSKIGEMFEEAITDKLRETMNA